MYLIPLLRCSQQCIKKAVPLENYILNFFTNFAMKFRLRYATG